MASFLAERYVIDSFFLFTWIIFINFVCFQVVVEEADYVEAGEALKGLNEEIIQIVCQGEC